MVRKKTDSYLFCCSDIADVNILKFCYIFKKYAKTLKKNSSPVCNYFFDFEFLALKLAIGETHQLW